MMKIFFTLVFLFPTLTVIQAQQASVLPPNVRAVYTIERLTDSNGLGTNEMMFGIPLPKGEVIGDTYLDTYWKQSAILLYEPEKMIQGYAARYDIQANELEVKTPTGIKVLKGNLVKSFAWIDSLKSEPVIFINAKEYSFNDTILNGFFELLVDGKISLFKKVNLTLKKADYNTALSMGSMDDKILKKSVYYIAKGKCITTMPNKKKKLLQVFGNDAEYIGTFIDQNTLSIKKEGHLIQIFDYFNSLTESLKK